MSDPFTLVVSAAGLASFGIQLLQGLNKYAGSALDSRERISAISTDIELAVQVVQALDATIKDDANKALVNNDAERLAQEARNQCWNIFTKIKDKLPKNTASTGPRKRDIFTWPFKEPSLELLRGNLEKVKTTLQLLMNVIILAAMTKRSISLSEHVIRDSTANCYYRQAEQAMLDQQRQQIKTLLEQKAAVEARLEALERDHAQALAAEAPTPTSSGRAPVQFATGQPSPIVGLAMVEQPQNPEVSSQYLAGPAREDSDNLALDDVFVSDCPSTSVSRSSRGSHESSASDTSPHIQGRVDSSTESNHEKSLSRGDLELELLMNDLHNDYTTCLNQLKTLQAKLEMALGEMFIPSINAPAVDPKLTEGNRQRLARAVDQSAWEVYDCLEQHMFGTGAHTKVIEQTLTGTPASLPCSVGGGDNHGAKSVHAETPDSWKQSGVWSLTRDGRSSFSYPGLSRSSFDEIGYATGPGNTGDRASHQYQTSASPEQEHSSSVGSSVAENVDMEQNLEAEPTRDEDITMQDFTGDESVLTTLNDGISLQRKADSSNATSNPDLDAGTLSSNSNSSSGSVDLDSPVYCEGSGSTSKTDTIVALPYLDPVDDLLDRWTRLYT